MSYQSPSALRAALEFRLLASSRESGVALDRLRRRVLFERIVARLQTAEPGLWVLKGGMALEVRLRDAARLTKDIDVGLRDAVADAADLHDRLISALTADPSGDGFLLVPDRPVQLRTDGGGHVTWRVRVDAHLADKPFGTIRIDVSPRTHELRDTDRVMLPNSLEFAGIPATEIEIIDVNRHAAEKLHGMTRDFGDRENSRVRDLLDLVLLLEYELVTPAAVARAVRAVWNERDNTEPPHELPKLPASWPERYERLAHEHSELEAQTFPAAAARAQRLWTDMFPDQEA